MNWKNYKKRSKSFNPLNVVYQPATTGRAVRGKIIECPAATADKVRVGRFYPTLLPKTAQSGVSPDTSRRLQAMRYGRRAG